jgi:hypothetical protein
MRFAYDRFGNNVLSIMAAMGALIVGSILISRLGKYRFA